MTKVRHRLFGSTRREVALVGQGTWRAEQASRRDAVAALQRGIAEGMTHIDTAEMYGSGEAESIVGAAIQGQRERIFLVSKVLPNNASRQGTIAACERSLARLGADHLDCYLLHWRGSHPLEETIAGFEALVKAGSILSWGVSNFDVDDLEEVAAIAGPGHPVCNQVLYHLAERAIEHSVLPWCQEHGTAVVAYTPFGESSKPYDPHSRQGRVLTEIAADHSATPRQVALAFLLRHPHTFVIPKAVDLAHVQDNAAAGALQLSAAQIERIDRTFPRGKPGPLPMI